MANVKINLNNKKEQKKSEDSVKQTTGQMPAVNTQPPQPQVQQQPFNTGMNPPVAPQNPVAQSQQQSYGVNGMPSQNPYPNQQWQGQNQPYNTGNIPVPQMNQPSPKVEKNESDEELDNKSKKKEKKKGKRAPKRKTKKGNNTPKNKEEAYKQFKIRKYFVFGTMIFGIVAIVGLGIYSTFFKEELTAGQAAAYTNIVNKQSTAQAWDSGVQGFLQKNLKTYLTAKFESSEKTVKEFTIDNISVEKNMQSNLTGGADIILCFFSVDITANGNTQRIFCMLPISVADNKFAKAGDLDISSWESYTVYSEKDAENPLLEFKIGEENIPAADQNETAAIKNALENFLTLGYNSKQSVDNIYKGSNDKALDFSIGTFESLDKCEVYTKDNALGYNTKVSYRIKLNNGATFTTTSYMKIENDGKAYVIKSIL